MQASTTRSKRRRLGLQHASAGKQPPLWEAPFVAAWGLHWRCRRDACKDLSSWMKDLPEFMSKLSEVWALPWLRTGSSETPGSAAFYTVKLPTSIDDIPYATVNPKGANWGTGCTRIWLQTDNQQVAEIFAGRSLYDDAYFRPVCVRIARALDQWLRGGRRPRVDTAPFVEWDPRCYNALADHAANVVLDGAGDWRRGDPDLIDVARSGGYYLRVSFDGARRGDGICAAGVAIAAYRPDGSEVHLVYRGGKYLGSLSSAFAAELLALEHAIDTITKFFPL